MSAPKPVSGDSVFDEAAAEWLFEREEGFTPARAQAFAEWCNCDPRHAQAVAQVERTLALLDEMPSVRSSLEARLTSSSTSLETPATSHATRFLRLAWAASFAALLLAGLGTWWGISVRVPQEEHYATDASAQRSLALPDGSVMDINIGSDVAVRFTARERLVTLNKGEAHFQVVHDTARPFVVIAGGVSVRAVGTAFNVRLGADAVDVLVVEGKIELRRSAVISRNDASTVSSTPLIRAGERAQMSRLNQSAALTIDRVDAPAIRTMLTWQNPMTSFTDVPLRDVVVRFNCCNTIQLVLEDADLRERKIGGKIALDQVDEFVRLLEQDGDVIADRATPGRITLRRAR
jgi:transmembrane sensor